MMKIYNQFYTIRSTALALAVVGLLAFLITPAAVASPPEQVPVGARPLAMGEAFVAVADDGNAIYWNPAGIASLNHHEISSMYSDLFGLGITSGYLSYVYPMTDRFALGLDWFNIGFDDNELGFNQNLFKLSSAYRIRENLNIGLNLKYLNSRTEIAFGPAGGSNGVGLDAGLLWIPHNWLRLGTTIQDFTNTRLRHDNGSSEVVYHRNTRVGAAVLPLKSTLLAVDLDDRIHFGGEHWIADILALRIGIQKDLHTSEPVTFSAGSGITHRFLRFDYAFTDAPTLGATHRFSLSAFFNLARSVVDIRKVDIEEIFPSLSRHYTHNPPVSLELFNRSSRSVEATVSLEIPGLMDAPSETTVVLRPEVITQVKLAPLFNESLLARDDDRSMRAIAKAAYQDDRKTRTSKKTGSVMAYSRGAIRWGTQFAAAFVTSTDPDVDQFARGVMRQLESVSNLPQQPNIMRAAALFDALSAAGVRYLPDAHNPYSVVSQADVAVDNVQYPRDMLSSKVGDCDDCSILLCSLLENVGIATALIDVPGHLLMMFDTGVHPRHRLELALADEMTIVYDNRVWVPIETTLLGETFTRAWQRGIARMSGLPSEEKYEVVNIHHAWQEYPPASLPVQEGAGRIEVPQVISGFKQEIDTLRAWNQLFLENEQNGLSAIDLGNLHALRGEDSLAARYFHAVLESDAHDATGLNNLGNLALLHDNLDSAIVLYQAAASNSPGDGGIDLNLGIAWFVAGEEDRSRSYLARGLQKLGSVENAGGLLGLHFDDMIATRGEQKPVDKETLKRLLERAKEKIPAAPADTLALEKIAPERKISRRAGVKGDDLESLRKSLYWKTIAHAIDPATRRSETGD